MEKMGEGVGGLMTKMAALSSLTCVNLHHSEVLKK